jgi:hypothetical protein
MSEVKERKFLLTITAYPDGGIFAKVNPIGKTTKKSSKKVKKLDSELDEEVVLF